MEQITRFPRTYLITPEPSRNEPLEAFVEQLDSALRAGVRLVQLRAKTVTPAQYAWLAEKSLTRCRRYDARLLLNAPLDVAEALQADGIHLTSTRLMACRRRLPPRGQFSAACHDEHQVRQASEMGADLLTISPVLPTAPPTTAVPLGWSRFRELVALTSVPVYALGECLSTLWPGRVTPGHMALRQFARCGAGRSSAPDLRVPSLRFPMWHQCMPARFAGSIVFAGPTNRRSATRHRGEALLRLWQFRPLHRLRRCTCVGRGWTGIPHAVRNAAAYSSSTGMRPCRSRTLGESIAPVSGSSRTSCAAPPA
ncbi:Thiamine-phosphate synthase [Pandoraea horticolens]|uniref:Thiamine-phosphate synthase n=1 Tax=Pandoraea horticolens TaxID=2508298 RepID=A0A5E4WUY0_9BURK|nr:thiamine phosphate synthase [Pandoraea horticolens]VVE27394.1 Thiamine-phosphate synthase [Pandoraea horticolens]